MSLRQERSDVKQWKAVADCEFGFLGAVRE